MSNYNSDYDRMARRRRTQRKSIITTVIAGVIIIAAVIAIILVILSLLKNSSNQQTTPAATETATVQPTLYQQTEPGTTAPTQSPTSAQPTQQTPAVTPTEQQGGSTVTEAPYETPTEADREPTEPIATGSSYTDDSGVLHVFTPSGTNWTYYSDGVSVKITCQPHYDLGQFEFLITGLIPGDTEFNVYYYTDEAQKEFVKVPVTANVDGNLRVTRTN